MAILSDNKPVGPTKEYSIASEGMATIVLADVEDIGIKETRNGPKPQVRLTWVVNEKNEDGEYYIIRREFTNSLHENSFLYPVVVDMLGKIPPVPYDLELLIGIANNAAIKHNKATEGRSAGKTFANITTMFALRPGQSFAVPKDFVRGKDGGEWGRKKNARGNNRGNAPQQAPRTAAPAQQQQTAPVQQIDDSDIPF